MARSRSIIIAGAGIGGLTASLALARAGFRVVLLEQAPRLEEVGAGIQLSPNATRVLLGLGLEHRLRPHTVVPDAIRILAASSGRDIVRIPLGSHAAGRYGAPYWIIHRADLQAVLLEAVAQHRDITLRLGARVEEFAVHPNGITVAAHTADGTLDEHGIALIGADGVWSNVRMRLGARPPRFAQRTAWRATLPAERVLPEFRTAATCLWLGPDAHLVHYPIKAGAMINIVTIVRDRWQQQGWSAEGKAGELAAHVSGFAPTARALVALPERWQKWALFDRRSSTVPAAARVALIGDAAHPMLPFLAQGGAMAIEDAAVLAGCLGRTPDDPDAALRAYDGLRHARIKRVQHESRRNGGRYHWGGARALVRDAILRRMGGERLLRRYDWLYDWRP